MHLPTRLSSNKAPLYFPLALLEVKKDDAEDVSQRESVNGVGAFVRAKAKSIKLRDPTSKWVQSSVSKAWFHRLLSLSHSVYVRMNYKLLYTFAWKLHFCPGVFDFDYCYQLPHNFNIVGSDVLSNITGICTSVGTNAL